MHRRLYISVALVVAAVAALTIGLAVASAQEDAALPALTPAELIAAVGEQGSQVPAVSGEFSWVNHLFGTTVFESFHDGGSGDGPDGSASGPGLDLLMRSGSGRLWLQGDKVRLESQGRHGDVAVYFDRTSLWVYDSGADTATEYILPGMPTADAPGGSAPEGSMHEALSAGGEGVDLPARIRTFIDELAPTATLSAGPGGDVAGRATYLLTMTPTASNTVFGSVRVAIDGETFVPLRLQVFTKGSDDPVLSAGFTSVSYDAVDETLFSFTPPADATVEQKTVALPDPAKMTAMTEAHPRDEVDRGPLTLAEAEAETGYPLMTPVDAGLAFHGAYVVPAHELPEAMGGLPEAMGGLPGAGGDSSGVLGELSPAGDMPGGLPTSIGPVAVLTYGEGFGTVVLVQAENQAGPAGWAALTGVLSQVPVFGQPVAVGDTTAYVLDTELGAVMLWERDGRVLVAAGMVSRADLSAFVARVR